MRGPEGATGPFKLSFYFFKFIIFSQNSILTCFLDRETFRPRPAKNRRHFASRRRLRNRQNRQRRAYKSDRRKTNKSALHRNRFKAADKP